MTIKVVAKHYVKPEKVEDYIDLSKELVKETLKEEGCIEYGLYQDSENPLILTMIEEWEDNKCLEKHFNSEHFKKIVPLMADLCENETEINVYNKIE
ncbi:putative quinol monooxygenase [Methanolobus sediminis]|uniref:Quinol monooxygenase n=1 Tax=Methanolobus sediminis TaxID=3072978 RepID=A0AA51UJX9_9EURY|nr:putative quinol monooxygenase [Methanolobus sediminis]WMW24936.1 putative quinol monooxygenase [Methanolobus sediminis]